MRRPASIRFTISLIMGTSLFCACGRHSIPTVEIGKPAPGFELEDVISHNLVSSESLKGNVIVLNFWSVTCANCLKELDDLNLIHNEHNAEVLGVVIDNDLEQVRDFLLGKKLDYTVLAGSEDLFVSFDGASLPYTIVLDANLNIRKKIYGLVEKSQLDAYIHSAKAKN